MNPKARLLGLAMDSATMERAGAHLDQVCMADIAADPLPFELPDGIDCIVYDDVLHRLSDPWDMVGRHARVLHRDGSMLIRVANNAYWRLTERRLRGAVHGGWREDGRREDRRREDGRREDGWYPDGGVGFDRDGLTDGLRQAGLTVFDIMPWEPESEAARQFCEALAPGLLALGIDPVAYERRALGSHLICRAARGSVPRMIVAGNMLAPVGGVSQVRVVEPLQAVGSEPGIAAVLTDRVTKGAAGEETPRIFVLHRPSLMGESGLDTLRRLTDAGYLIITEFDDHPDHFKMMQQGGDLSFRGVHAVQTSTIGMANVLRGYNPEVAVFPNALVSLPPVRNFTDPGCMTLFFGALNRERDWQRFMPMINAVAVTVGERIRFQVLHDRLFFDALQTPHKTFTPTCDYETYWRILSESEISFMPLGDTPFNRAKSDLKFIEAGACRVAALASSVVYGDSIDDGRTGLLFRDQAAFHTGLLRLVAMPAFAQALGDAGRQYVSEHRMLAYQAAPRIAWYRSLWIRREALEAARQARLHHRWAGV